MNPKLKLFLTYFFYFIIISGILYFAGKYAYYNMKFKESVELFIFHSLIGFFVSFVFILLLLWFLRPTFQISPYICKRNNVYHFKIINKSIYHAFDAKAELFLIVPENHGGANSNANIYSKKLRTSNITKINRYRKNYFRKDPFAMFAITFFTEENLEVDLDKDNAFLEFNLTVRHGLTGLADTFTQQFTSKSVIKSEHKFVFGNSLLTMPKNQSF